MNDLATHIEANNKTMMRLFDERKEMILQLMAMVEKLHKDAVIQQGQIVLLKKEVLRLRAKGVNKPMIKKPSKTPGRN